jgi:hypothetical protein
MSLRAIRSFGAVCSAWMALTLPALANAPADAGMAGSGRRLLICSGGSAGVVQFGTRSARLSPAAKAALAQIAIWARDDSSRSVRLWAMTDRSGNARANAKLSQRRGKAVESYLESRGLDLTQVTALGHTSDERVDEIDNQRAVNSQRTVNLVTCSTPSLIEAPRPPPVETPRGPRSGVGIGVTVGGGLTGFVDEQARAFVGTGPSWDARITIGTRLPVAFEGAYTGSAQDISAPGINKAILLGNGAEGALRLNLTQIALQPYLFGGLGWTRYEVHGTSETSWTSQRTDYILTVPFGAGIAARVAAGLLLDLRVTGRAAFGNDLMDGASTNTGRDARLHSWNFGGRLGWEF